MRLKENASKKKLTGTYYTPDKLAHYMVSLFNNTAIKKILEPSCGDGVFINKILNSYSHEKDFSIKAIEIDKNIATAVKKKYKSVNVKNSDFFQEYTKMLAEEENFDLIIGNPPYIRYQYLTNSQREVLSEILKSHGMEPNKLINSWVGFLVACSQLLAQDGQIAFVLPAEILQVAYAEDLRVYLTNTFPKITIITFGKLVFEEIEQEIVVFIGDKKGKSSLINVIEVDSLDDLTDIVIEEKDYQPLNHVKEKWTKYFTSKEENILLENWNSDTRFRPLADFGIINVGITTGNNKFFSLTKEQVESFSLLEYTLPLLGRSVHIAGLTFTQNDLIKNINENKRAYLLTFPNNSLEKFSQGAKKYIKLGEENNENKGYKCSIREYWYSIPSIWIPDAFFLRRNNIYPKFILNCCNAVSTDTMHRIKFNNNVNPKKVILGYYNSISFAFSEFCGRSYGGGVLEILPTEVGKILIPDLSNISNEIIDTLFDTLDQMIRSNAPIEEILNYMDNEILINNLNISLKTCIQFRKIWEKMKDRRLNRTN